MDKSIVQKIGLGACGLMAISVFLPWISFMGMSANLFSGSALRAILIILLSAMGGLMIFKEIKLAIAPIGGAAFIAITILFEGVPFSFLGFGFYLTIVGAAAAIYASLPYLKDGKEFSVLIDWIKELTSGGGGS